MGFNSAFKGLNFENYHLLEHYVVFIGNLLLMFHRSSLPSSSRYSKNKLLGRIDCVT